MGILKSLLDIAQLRERLSNNVKVQEGDEPAEDPEDLFQGPPGTGFEASAGELDDRPQVTSRGRAGSPPDGR